MANLTYDGDGVVFGRLASKVSKDLLNGDNVVVINCDKIIISGDKKLLAKKILAKREMGSGGSMKGPKYPRVSDRLVKRMIRGMLPWDRDKGRSAFRRLRCNIGGEIKNSIKLDYRKPVKYSTIAEIVRLLK